MNKHLADRRRHIATSLRALVDRNPGARWSAANQKSFEYGIAEIDDLDESIRRETARTTDSTSAECAGIELLRTYLTHGAQALSPAQQRVYATMSTTTGSQGGFTVAANVTARIADAMKDYSGVRRVAEVIVTDKGNAMPWPTSDGTAETGELVAENTTTTAADPSFGTAPITAWKYSSKVATVPFELLQDSAVDLEGFIADRLAQRIGRLSNTHFTTGTGTAQPTGFVTGASVGKTGTAGQTTTVIHDDIVDLVHSINGEYRQDPHGAQFMTSDAGFKMLRKLKDSSNRPIYLPSDGQSPETILGYPVVINNDIATPAASAKSIYFGNWWKAYKVRDVLDVTLFRMTDSFYAKQGQVGFLAFMRSGGNLVDTAAVKAYQHPAA